MTYTLYTLIDITETKIHHGPDRLAKCQQQNFETVLQTIGLCGNVYYSESPTVCIADRFSSAGKMWVFQWEMEIDELFSEDNNPIGKLPKLFEFVPVILNLTETDKTVPMFVPNQNILFSVNN